jgi:hypothetical protein
MQPLKARYFEGETIRIAIHIDYARSAYRPYNRGEEDASTRLFQDGKGVDCISVQSSCRDSSINGNEFSDTLTIGSRWSKNSGPPDGFYHLTPGHYSGYFSAPGVISNQFNFTIVKPPKSQKSYWNVYCKLKTMEDRYWGMGQFLVGTYTTPELSPQQLLDSMWVCSMPFIERPAKSLWRASAIGTALGISGRFREDWRPSDSLHCERLLMAYVFEWGESPNMAIGLAGVTLFKNITGDSLRTALTDFAKRNRLPNYEDEVAKTVKQHPSVR